MLFPERLRARGKLTILRRGTIDLKLTAMEKKGNKHTTFENLNFTGILMNLFRDKIK